MDRQTIALLRHYAERYNTGDARPNCLVDVYRMDREGGYEPAAFTLPNVMEISLDRRYNLAASELKVMISNDKGELSPNYAPGKSYDHVKGLQMSGFTNVLVPFNKIVLQLGYGEEMRTMFTGQIVDVSIRENPPSITLTCKDMYRKLLKAIDPEETKALTYIDQTAGYILRDLLLKAGLEKYLMELGTIDGEEYVIPKKVFPLGTQYSNAVKEILEMLDHRIYCSRDGFIIIEPAKRYTQEEAAKLELNDYVNLTSGDYALDATILRNRVVVQANDGWRAFEDLGMIDDCNGEKISCGLESPWATDEEDGTPKRKQAVADRFFMDQRKQFRKITIGAKGHPALDVGDLVKVRTLISTANSNYMITGIKTSYSTMGYIDTIDLEYVAADVHIAALAEGQYQGAEDGGSDTVALTIGKRKMIVAEAKRHMDTLYQYGGDRLHHAQDFYGVDNEHFLWYVYEQFGLLDKYHTIGELYQLCQSVTEENLQEGDLVFYSADGSAEGIQQAAIYLGDNKVIAASGGSMYTTTAERARETQAFVKVLWLTDNPKPRLYGTLLKE